MQFTKSYLYLYLLFILFTSPDTFKHQMSYFFKRQSEWSFSVCTENSRVPSEMEKEALLGLLTHLLLLLSPTECPWAPRGLSDLLKRKTARVTSCFKQVTGFHCSPSSYSVDETQCAQDTADPSNAAPDTFSPCDSSLTSLVFSPTLCSPQFIPALTFAVPSAWNTFPIIPVSREALSVYHLCQVSLFFL